MAETEGRTREPTVEPEGRPECRIRGPDLRAGPEGRTEDRTRGPNPRAESEGLHPKAGPEGQNREPRARHGP